MSVAGCSGAQVCLSDGSGYGECQCPPGDGGPDGGAADGGGVAIILRVITSACDSTPLASVTHLEIRVSGDALPMTKSVSLVSVAAQNIELPQVLAGANRVIEVRGYAGDPGSGGVVKSIGRTLPFTVPSVLPEGFPVTNVFLRQVDTFSQPSRAVSPGICSRMVSARAGHTATVLQDGRVFIAGGYQQSTGPARSAIYKAEFYNPATGGFDEAPDLGVLSGPAGSTTFTALARAFHTATLLGNGQVLLWMGEEYATGDVNGDSPVLRASVLIYDPVQNGYGGLPLTNLNNIMRSHHSAARDASGKVVIVGGMSRGGSPARSVIAEKVEWYDAATTYTKVVDGVTMPRKDMSMLAVQGGLYLAVAGGSDGLAVKDDITFFNYRATPSPAAIVQVDVASPPRLRDARRSAAQATLNGSNDLIIIGGYSDAANVKPLKTTEVISTKNAFNVADGPALAVARGDICATTLGDGRVLAIGGRTSDPVGSPPRSDATVDIIVPQPGGAPTVVGHNPLKTARYNHTCTTLADGSVLVLGGVRETSGNTFEVLSDALIYTPTPIDP
jgi:hypothetical protein